MVNISEQYFRIISRFGGNSIMWIPFYAVINDRRVMSPKKVQIVSAIARKAKAAGDVCLYEDCKNFIKNILYHV
jgi:hypothetical protein